MNFVPLAAMAALVIAIINLLQYARAKDTNGVLTTLAAWVAGLVVVFLGAETDFANSIKVTDDLSLGALNTASKVLVGLTVAASGQLAVQFKRAIDTSDSAKKPDLLTGSCE